MKKTVHSIIDYHRPRNSVRHWLQSMKYLNFLFIKISNIEFIFRYPAQVIRVDTSGKRFDRQSAARKSLLHVQTGIAAQIEDQENDSSNTDSVKRRSRSRKPRGNRRNTIAGIDQTEIEEIAINGFVTFIPTVACCQKYFHPLPIINYGLSSCVACNVFLLFCVCILLLPT